MRLLVRCLWWNWPHNDQLHNEKKTFLSSHPNLTCNTWMWEAKSEHNALGQCSSRVSSIFGDFVAGDNDVHVGGETSGYNPVLEYLTRGEERWQEGLMDPCSMEGFVLAARNPLPPIPALSCVGGRFQYVPATAWPTVLNARFLNLASFYSYFTDNIRRFFVSRHTVWSCQTACCSFFSSFQFCKYIEMDQFRAFGKWVARNFTQLTDVCMTELQFYKNIVFFSD